MFCPECGARIAEGGKFCMHCGHRTEEKKVDGSGYFFAAPSLGEESAPQPRPEAAGAPPVVQEAPPAQPVLRHIPAQAVSPVKPVPVPPPAPVMPPKKKKKKRILPVILILCLVLLAVGGVAAVFLLGGPSTPMDTLPETIFLLTSAEMLEGSTGVHCVETLDYEDDGTLLGYSARTEGGNEFGISTQREITYEYDDGLLETVQIQSGEETYEITFEYDDEVLESISGRVPEGELTGTCDRDGKILQIEIRDESGEILRSIDYAYEDGVLEEKVETVGNYVYTYRYQEGKLTQIRLENGNEEVYRYEYTYNQRGYLTEEVRYVDEEQQYAIRYECVYEDELLSELVIVLEDEIGKTELECEVEWDDTEAEITISGRDTEGNRIPEDCCMQLEYDDDGNLLHALIIADGETLWEYTYTYLEIEDPEDYVVTDPLEPQWFIQFA